MEKQIKNKIKEIIVVEGRYDKNTILQAIDATVIETSGFGVLKDKDKLSLIKRLSEKNGLVIFTDSDRAGFFIRSRLNDVLGLSNVKHAYIPDVEGKERRKASPSKEGKLGVEGMSVDVIIRALKTSGATFCGETDARSNYGLSQHKDKLITNNDMFQAGMVGSDNSAIKRRNMLTELGLPTRLSSKATLNVLNILLSKDEFLQRYGSQK